MQTIVVKGTARTDLGKKATRTLRGAGLIPCNLYGGETNVNFQAPASEFRKLIYTSDFNIASVEVDGKTYSAIVKDIQFDPVKDHVTHIDFQELVPGKEVKISLPIRLIGTPKGAAMGGKLEQTLKRLPVLAKPEDLVTAVEVNVEDVDLGGIKRIKDIQLGNIKALLANAMPVVRMGVPRAAKEAAAAEAKKK